MCGPSENAKKRGNVYINIFTYIYMYIHIHTVCVYSIYTYMRMFLYMIYIYIYIHIKLDILICILIDGWIAIKCFTELKETGTGTCIQLCKWNGSHNLHTTSHHITTNISLNMWHSRLSQQICKHLGDTSAFHLLQAELNFIDNGAYREEVRLPSPPHTVWVKYDEWARLLFYKTLYKMCSKQNKKRNKKEVSTDTPGRVYQQVQNKLDCYCWKSINDKPLGKCGLCVQ